MTATQKTILLIDDEERLLSSMAQRISLLGFTPLKASSGEEALKIAKSTHIDLAIVDLKMPDMDGLVTITKLKELVPNLKTVLLTGYGSEKTRQATEALGSIYIEKDSMGGLWDIIRQSSSQGKVVVIKPSSSRHAKMDGSGMPEQIEIMDHRQYEMKQMPSRTLPKIIGDSTEVQRLRKNINRFAEMDCAIVLKGESGTGKELVARTIHHLSHRNPQRFLAFDCGCFSNDFHFSQLFESMEQPTGQPSHGKDSTPSQNLSFAGTIFLDHIENMPQQTQEEMTNLLDAKLDGSFPAIDIRFIVVASPKLEEKIVEGHFQQELYRRIHAIELAVPPLRNRIDDLPILIKYFLKQFNQEFDKNIRKLSENAFNTLKSYRFPGNIRELKHIIERAVILADSDIITLSNLPERFQKDNSASTIADNQASFPTLQMTEQKQILKALQVTNGNKTRASELLGISRAALWRKLRDSNHSANS